MDIDAAETSLHGRLSRSRELNEAHLRGLGIELPTSLVQIAAIGIDTNVLKALRKDLPYAEQVFLTLSASGVKLIVPSQTLTEYWNNHQLFADEEGKGFRGDLMSLKTRLEAANFSGFDTEVLGDIASLVDRLAGDLEDPKSPAYFEKSVDLIKTMLGSAVVPHASRGRFADLGMVRQFSKTPPGFADEKEKAAASGGDFFVWCDFLLGCLLGDPTPGRRYLWVTNEAKRDWKTSTHGHPALVEEFYSVCEGELSIVNFAQLSKIIRDDDKKRVDAERAAERAAVAVADTIPREIERLGAEDWSTAAPLSEVDPLPDKPAAPQ
ncbi:PIN-like domain-containing protein [Microbacterium marmarense]|uniref:PIN-like domain-containing protein n=1 Tax=Microbacterium marmarense TaxID=3122051 RepID=A0ABU8LQT0_9MICO